MPAPSSCLWTHTCAHNGIWKTPQTCLFLFCLRVLGVLNRFYNCVVIETTEVCVNEKVMNGTRTRTRTRFNSMWLLGPEFLDQHVRVLSIELQAKPENLPVSITARLSMGHHASWANPCRKQHIGVTSVISLRWGYDKKNSAHSNTPQSPLVLVSLCDIF